MEDNKVLRVSLITRANLRVLTRICEIGESISNMSYRDIGKMLGMSYENVRYHFKALERNGYLTIEKQSAKKFVFHINVEKLKELIK